MERNNFNDIGREIRDAVQNAVNSMDFAELNQQITDSVNEALDEIQNAFKENAGRSGQAGRQQAAAQKTPSSRMKEEASQVRNAVRRRADLIARRPKGTVSHVLFTVFGSVLLGVGILLALLFGTIALTGDIEFNALLVLLGLVIAPVGGCGAWMLIRGAANRGRLERFRTYTSCFKNQTYIKISELAAAVHKTEKFVVKDLKKMIDLGMFPQGHINGDQTLFILDHATYTEYEAMRREVEKKSKAMQAESREEQQLRETVERGQDYLAAIRRANDAIPGAEISEKLTRLEKSVDRIYSQIRKAPEKLPELRRFQEYYLPTTLKLVETYREFDAQPIAGENITTAKKEIEASLDTINQAFEKLFDSLFADKAMDVSADISVLQTLLAQEGLTEEAWKAATQTGTEYLWEQNRDTQGEKEEKPDQEEKLVRTMK